MATCLPPPDAPAIVDYGTAPEIFVDGMCCYCEKNGVIRSAFYANQVQQCPETGATVTTRVVTLRLIYSKETQVQFRRYMADMLSERQDARSAEFREVLEGARH